MDNAGDTSESAEPGGRVGDLRGGLHLRVLRHGLTAVMALIALGSLATSVPYWNGSEFPVTSLIVYVAGMVFIAMPLCMYYESRLQAYQQRIARWKRAHGDGFDEPASYSAA